MAMIRWLLCAGFVFASSLTVHGKSLASVAEKDNGQQTSGNNAAARMFHEPQDKPLTERDLALWFGKYSGGPQVSSMLEAVQKNLPLPVITTEDGRRIYYTVNGYSGPSNDTPVYPVIGLRIEEDPNKFSHKNPLISPPPPPPIPNQPLPTPLPYPPKVHEPPPQLPSYKPPPQLPSYKPPLYPLPPPSLPPPKNPPPPPPSYNPLIPPPPPPSQPPLPLSYQPLIPPPPPAAPPPSPPIPYPPPPPPPSPPPSVSPTYLPPISYEPLALVLPTPNPIPSLSYEERAKPLYEEQPPPLRPHQTSLNKHVFLSTDPEHPNVLSICIDLDRSELSSLLNPHVETTKPLAKATSPLHAEDYGWSQGMDNHSPRS